ncbi:hypothetical protein HPB48_022409 [Haemaphysalis longicornis]|uniref:Uncharacterized protein n=1 Tax=Haemaphysalis longicornis TaxID=44386 RepID=A0A9J6GV64_HAELO|nr:hypothetical protein HPB48_022409 [Haemaphysalis longicornis]
MKIRVAMDPFLSIPRHENVRCAVCNRDFNVKMWKAFLRLISDERASIQACSPAHNRDPLHARQEAAAVLPACAGLTSSPTAPADFHDRNSRLRDECHAYFAPVRDRLTGVGYKNAYCALCYGVGIEDMACVEDESVVDMATPSPTRMCSPSYALLIDVDFARGGAKVGLQDRCAPNQAYDPWKETCRNLVCGKLYELRDGRCVASALQAAYGLSKVPLHALLASNCSRVALDADEFILWENHTATLRGGAGSGELLVPGEYELRSDGSMLVCADTSFLPAHRMSVYKFRDTHGYITLAGSLVSLACLLVKMVLQLLAPGPSKLPDQLISMLSFSIFAAQLLFLFVMVAARHRALCMLIGMLVHYFFLASGGAVGGRRPVAPPRGHPLAPGYGRGVCWISSRLALLAFFAAPIGLIVAINMVLFVICVVRISGTLTQRDKLRRSARSTSRSRLLVYIKLALVMGATWTLGFVAPFARVQALWHAFVILNSLQGAFVFFAFTRLTLGQRLASWIQRRRSNGSSSRRTVVSVAPTLSLQHH